MTNTLPIIGLQCNLVLSLNSCKGSCIEGISCLLIGTFFDWLGYVTVKIDPYKGSWTWLSKSNRSHVWYKGLYLAYKFCIM